MAAATVRAIPARKTNTFLFGFSPLDGSWSLNSKGQIVGFYSQVLNVSSTVTNFHAGTEFGKHCQ